MRKRSWISCAAALALSFGAGSQALAQGRLYFSGPYGVGGTYNVYELKGAGARTITAGSRLGRYKVLNATNLSFETGAAETMFGGNAAAIAATEDVSGTNKPGHLVAMSGALGPLENNFVALNIAFIGTSATIGLTDDETFGGVETRSEPKTGEIGAPQGGCGASCADEQTAGLNGNGQGWVWTNGEPYTFHNWNGGGEPNDYADNPAIAGGGEDATELLPGGAWNDVQDGDPIEGGGARPYVVEYETRSATPINIPNAIQLSPTAEKTPGGNGGNGFMSIREVHNGATAVSGNAGAVGLLFSGGSAEVNYTAPVLNINPPVGAGGGQFGGDSNFGLDTVPALTGTDINNFALRAHGYVTIPAGQGGQYTFDVNTDDSGELYIYGKTFESVSNGAITAHGSLAFLGDRGAADTLGVITLQPGEYEFEYVMNENGGGASAEFSAAKGAFTAFSPLDFRLVGGDPNGFEYAGGTTPVTGGDFQIKEVLAQPDGRVAITTMALAKDLLNNPLETDLVETGTDTVVNHRDPTTNAGEPAGRFADSRNFLNDTSTTPPDFDDNDFVFNAKTTVVIETAGDYTFGFDSDDGAEIILEGANFTTAFGPAISNGNALTADILTGSSLSAGWTFLEPGTYDLEFTMFERGGGAFAELFVAPGRAPGFSTDLFSLLGSPARTVAPRSIAGALQLGDGIVEPGGQDGDTDGDGDVDLDDLNGVRNNFGANGASDGSLDGDAFPFDGTVDLDDLNGVRNNFGAVGGANAVPEPSSVVLVGLGLVGLLAARRFRK